MNDERYLERAVALARRGPRPDPNPQVGCVVVANGQVVGEGWHEGAGTPHAEVAALALAGHRARGATAYVTLEPCAHAGRTGPCTQALLDAGIARVVHADADPDPQAAGGSQWLRAHGIEVEQAGPSGLNREWLHAARTGRPFVTWKYAATLDGRSAAADGSSRWITGPMARADVHARRAEVGAVVVGTGTILADDPALTARPDGVPAARQPVRVVIGSRDIPSGARVLDEAAPTLRAATPEEALAELHGRGIRHVWLEGGPILAASFLRTGLVDEVVAYLAPRLLGAGPAAVGDLGIGSIDGALDLTLSDVTRLGDDLRLTLTRPPLTSAALLTADPAPTRQGA